MARFRLRQVHMSMLDKCRKLIVQTNGQHFVWLLVWLDENNDVLALYSDHQWTDSLAVALAAAHIHYHFEFGG